MSDDPHVMTPRLLDILEAAEEISDRHGHAYLGVEHVQLAILADERAVPTQLLRRMGLDLEAIAAELTAAIQTAGYKTSTRRATRRKREA